MARSRCTSCCREDPGRYADPAVAGIRHLLGVPDGAPIPAGADLRGPPGHHGRDQCPAGTQGRADGPGHHPRIRGRAADRLPGPAADLRPADRPPGDGVLAGDRGHRADRGPRRGRRRPGRGRGARATCGPPTTRASGRWRWCACTATGTRRTRPGSARSPAGRVHPGVAVACDQPADEAGVPGRHHAGGRLPVAHPRPLRGSGRQRAGWRPAAVHAVQRRPHRRPPVPGQGLDPVRAGRRHRRHGPHRARRRALPR